MWPCIWEVVRSREIQPLIQERRLSTLDGKGFLLALTRTFAMPCVLFFKKPLKNDTLEKIKLNFQSDMRKEEVEK